VAVDGERFGAQLPERVAQVLDLEGLHLEADLELHAWPVHGDGSVYDLELGQLLLQLLAGLGGRAGRVRQPLLLLAEVAAGLDQALVGLGQAADEQAKGDVVLPAEEAVGGRLRPELDAEEEPQDEHRGQEQRQLGAGHAAPTQQQPTST
jgi:hypothetical protein